MVDTANKVSRMIARMLMEHNITDVVLSPGSRNTPLIIACNRQRDLHTHVVIDERSAAFIALGMANASNRPVALICTSGTAPLNYAPAVAEAFYRKTPLLVITADRPSEWIDQDDSQTIRQPGIYANFIKGTFDIPTENDDATRMWYINRTLNDAMCCLETGCPGPVHINVRLDNPLGTLTDVSDEEQPRIIRTTATDESINNIRDDIAGIISSKRIMFVVGFSSDPSLCNHIEQVAKRSNVVVLHEAQSNIHSCSNNLIGNIDATMCQALNKLKPEYIPEVVITLGGALVSRKVKAWLRQTKGIKHISVGLHDHAVDCFKHLTHRVVADEATFLQAFNSLPTSTEEISDYKAFWEECSLDGLAASTATADESKWCDFKAWHYIIENIKPGTNVQVSNGTPARYIQLMDYRHLGSIECNRGVSGIDGCTSTAIGYAMASDRDVVLISGDMSFQYDIGALATKPLPENLKMIVINNGGGGIFRYISTTRSLPELETFFAGPINLPLEGIAKAYSIPYFKASEYDELKVAMNAWSSTAGIAILEVVTPHTYSADVISKFLN